MRTTIAAALLLAALAGCGTSSDEAASTGTSDCEAGIRFKGATYLEAGYSDVAGERSGERSGERAGEAILGECDDQGADAAGLAFPEDARTVKVWAVPHVEPDQAVGLRTADGFQVFVADGLDADERAYVVTRLGLGEDKDR